MINLESKLKLFFKTAAKVSIVLLVLILIASYVFYAEKLSFLSVVLFVLPYYVLWIALLGISIYTHNKPFTAIWSRTLREEGVLEYPNIIYALIFLFGSVAIYVLQ